MVGALGTCLSQVVISLPKTSPLAFHHGHSKPFSLTRLNRLIAGEWSPCAFADEGLARKSGRRSHGSLSCFATVKEMAKSKGWKIKLTVVAEFLDGKETPLMKRPLVACHCTVLIARKGAAAPRQYMALQADANSHCRLHYRSSAGPKFNAVNELSQSLKD